MSECNYVQNIYLTIEKLNCLLIVLRQSWHPPDKSSIYSIISRYSFGYSRTSTAHIHYGIWIEGFLDVIDLKSFFFKQKIHTKKQHNNLDKIKLLHIVRQI